MKNKRVITEIIKIIAAAMVILCFESAAGTVLPLAPSLSDAVNTAPSLSDAFNTTPSLSDAFNTPEPAYAATKKKVKISNAKVRKFLHKSCFIGSSVELGRANFTQANWNKSMGKPLFMARVSYSILNDRYKNHGFMIQYKGREMQARYAIKASGKKNVFLNMGINEISMPVQTVYKDYVRFIKEIRATNPKVRIFIEACTPMRSENSSRNNKKIRSLNSKMKKYAKSQKNVFFVDVNKPLSGKDGLMKKEYCSDNYVHITKAGAKKWNQATFKYVRKYLKKRKLHQIKVTEIKKRRAQPTTDIVRWSKKTKHLYYNNDKIVKGVAFYKDKFYAFTKKKGTYKKGMTKKLRRAYKPSGDASKLIKLLGKPKKTTFQDSCYGDGNYKDGIREYKLFILTTLKDKKTGKETIYGVTSKY